MFLTNVYIKACHWSKGAIIVTNFMSRLDPKKPKRPIIAYCVKQTCKKRGPKFDFQIQSEITPSIHNVHVQSLLIHRDESFYSSLSMTHRVQNCLNQHQEQSLIEFKATVPLAFKNAKLYIQSFVKNYFICGTLKMFPGFIYKA